MIPFRIDSINILGNSSIGLFGYANDRICILPFNLTTDIVKKVEDTLDVPIIQASVASSNLIGIFVAGNSSTILCPDLVTMEEYTALADSLPSEVRTEILPSKITALGNAIIADDKRALLHPEFTKLEVKAIGDLLDVETVQRTILGIPLVGSLLFQNSNGILAHPLVEEDELEWIRSYFQRDIDIVTVNRGTPFPRPGLLANKNGALSGGDTTGPELQRIYQVLSG